MKKFFIGLLTAICIVCFAFFTVSCAEDGQNGKDGLNGKDGVSISKTEINAEGELILTMTDGTVINVGKVEGTDGKDGAQGPQGEKGKDGADGQDGAQGPQGETGNGIVKAEINTNGELILTYTDGTIVNLGKITESQAELPHKITLDANGGTGQSGFIELKNGQIGVLPKNMFVKDDCDFVGWSTEPNGAVVYTDGAQIIGAAKDMTLYAVWEKVTTDVIFNANGGSGTMGTVKIRKNSKSPLPKNAFTKQDYDFVGWSIEKNGVVVYADGAQIVGTDKDITLYAVWEKATTDVTFNANGGSGTMEMVKIRKNSSSPLPKNMFVKSGYEFLGWAFSAKGEVAYSDEAVFDSSENDVILYAVWREPVTNEAAFFTKENVITGLTEYGKTLSKIIIPLQIDGIPITSIGDCAFAGCRNLTSITIPDSITSIGSSVFDGCNKLQYNAYENALYLGNASNPYHVFIKATDQNIVSCTIAESTKIIYYHAFYHFSRLSIISIPNSVTSIGTEVFRGCSGLPRIKIGNSVTSIGHGAFYDCNSLTSVIIGNSVKSIGECAFYDCSNLTSITIGNSVTSIGRGAFFGCNSLTSVSIPDSVTSIGIAAFSFCSSLTCVTIGNSVTSIGEEAFFNCGNLQKVYYNGTETQWNSINIDNGFGNDPLRNATRYYYSKAQPATVGNYWHYVNGKITEW